MKFPVLAAVFIIVLVSGLILSGIPQFKKEMKKSSDREASYGAVVNKTKAGETEYSVSGRGYPVIISHGITGGVGQCFGLASLYLPENMFKIIAVSRFGYGKTQMPVKAAPENQADAFAALLDSLNIEKAAILGNSGGAAAAIQFAIKYPDRCSSVTMISGNVPNPAGTPPKPIMQALFGSDYLYWSVVSLFGSQMLTMAGIPEDLLKTMSKEEKDKHIEGMMLAALPISSRTKGVINDMYVSNTDMARGYDFKSIQVPVLVIHAKNDPLGPFMSAETVASQIPGCEFMAVQDGGHLLLGHEEEVRKKAGNFITKNMVNK